MTRLDSARALTVLAAHDDAYRELTQTLYGGDVAPATVWADVFAKSNPTAADVHVPAGPQLRSARVRRTNPVARAAAITATGVGAVLGVKELAEQAPEAFRVLPTGRRAFRAKAGWVTENKTGRFPRVPRPGPALRVAGTSAMFGGDLLATHQLRRNNGSVVVKSVLTDLADGYAHQARQLVRRLVPAGTGGHRAPFTGGPAKPRRAAGGPGVRPASGQRTSVSPGSASARMSGVHGEVKADQHTLFGIGGSPSPEGATVGGQRGQEAGYRAGRAVKTATATPRRKAAVAAGGVVAAAGAVHHRGGGGQQPLEYPGPTPYYYTKRAETDVEVEWAGTFSKFDSDKRLAFGWASMSKVDGLPVVDRQNDIILPEDIEEAVYAYVVGSRVGGDMHERDAGLFGKAAPGAPRPGLGLWEQSGTDEPRKVADLVESMVFTDEKIEKMGLPDTFPRGWWVGFRYHDDDVWAAIKDGRRTGFSIHGKGLREPVDMDELMYGVA